MITDIYSFSFLFIIFFFIKPSFVFIGRRKVWEMRVKNLYFHLYVEYYPFNIYLVKLFIYIYFIITILTLLQE